MLKDIIHVKPLANYHLHLEFEDGVKGTVDIAGLVPFTGVFAPLADEAYFFQVEANPETGTVCWPNGADLDPDVLYALVTEEPIPDLTPTYTN